MFQAAKSHDTRQNRKILLESYMPVIPATMESDKFTRASLLLQELGMDGWLISCNEDSDIHSPYMLGLKSHARHFIFVDANGNHRVLAVPMEAPMIRKEMERRSLNVQVIENTSSNTMKQWLVECFKGKSRIALNFGEDSITKGTSFADWLRAGEFQSLTRMFPSMDFVSAAPLISRLRGEKSREEIANLKEAVKITIEVLESLPDKVTTGMSEKEVQAWLHYEYMKIGEPSFETIVATGENSADPHHNTSLKKIERGVLLVDTGIRYKQVSSDITWTFWVGNEPDEQFSRAYDCLMEAKRIANKYMVANGPTNVPAIKCRDHLGECGYDHEKLFIHGLGHALGYEVHDVGPRMSWRARTDELFPPDSIYTNEPGLYWDKKYGIRLEDDVVVRKSGAEQVSRCPRDPPVI